MSSKQIDLAPADFWELQALLYKTENARLVFEQAQAEALAKVRSFGVDTTQPWTLDGTKKALVVNVA